MSTPDSTKGQTPPTSTLRVCSETVGTEPNIAEQELEKHIKDCGELIKKAFAEGDSAAGYQHMQNMYAAIRSRTPEHQARLTARIDSAIWFQSPEAQEMGKGAA